MLSCIFFFILPYFQVVLSRNLKLLSFGEEAEEEEEAVDITKKFKGKSSHDLTNDPSLSAVPAVEVDEKATLAEEEQK